MKSCNYIITRNNEMLQNTKNFLNINGNCTKLLFISYIQLALKSLYALKINEEELSWTKLSSEMAVSFCILASNE